MMCQALELAWCATWEDAGQYGKAASGVGRLVATGHRPQLDVKQDIRVEARVGLRTMAVLSVSFQTCLSVCEKFH